MAQETTKQMIAAGGTKKSGAVTGIANLLNLRKAFDDAQRKNKWELEKLQEQRKTAFGTASIQQRAASERTAMGMFGVQPSYGGPGRSPYTQPGAMVYGQTPTGGAQFKGTVGPELSSLPGFSLGNANAGVGQIPAGAIATGGQIGPPESRIKYEVPNKREQLREIYLKAAGIADKARTAEYDVSRKQEVYDTTFRNALGDLQQIQGLLSPSDMTKIRTSPKSSGWRAFYKKAKKGFSKRAILVAGPLASGPLMVEKVKELLAGVRKGNPTANASLGEMIKSGAISIDQQGNVYLNQE